MHNRILGFVFTVMTALAVGATQTAYAADGWFNGAKVNLVFTNANGELRIRTDPQPQNAPGADFGCSQPTLILGFSEGLEDDDALGLFALARMHETVLEAHLSSASVDMYLDEVSSGTAVVCYVNRLQIHPPTQTLQPPPTPNPPTGDYYGALAIRPSDSRPALWGHSVNKGTIAEADRTAKEACVGKGAYSCDIYERFGDGECLVVYAGDNDFFITWNTAPQAGLDDLQRRGLAYCESEATGCNRVISACNTGTSSGIAPQTAPKSLRRK